MTEELEEQQKQQKTDEKKLQKKKQKKNESIKQKMIWDECFMHQSRKEKRNIVQHYLMAEKSMNKNK